MSLRTMLQKKFHNLFVAIVMNETECVLRCKVIKEGSIKKSITKVFPLSGSMEVLDKNVESYLLALQEEYTFVYIAFLLNAMGQGAFEGVGEKAFAKHSVDSKNVHAVVMQKQWTTYASFIEIKWTKNLFSETGVDLIYTPFVLLSDFIAAQKSKPKFVCYLLNAQDFFVLAIMEGTQFHFGAFFKTQNDSSFAEPSTISDWGSEQEEEGMAELMEIPEIARDDEDDGSMSDLAELGDIDDLHAVDSFSDFETPKTLGHFQGVNEVREEDTSLELYGRDVLLYKYLKSSLEEYYHNPVYVSEFIEEIVIFDGYEVSSDLIHQLEDELLMEVEIHKVDLADRLCDIAIKEVFE